MLFDIFSRWQLAGDEIAPDQSDANAATGFISASVNTILPERMFMTDARVSPGVRYVELDEIGYRAMGDRVSVHDLHATILHVMGMDHKQLTYLHNGRRYRLTDVAGGVLHPILT